MEWRTFYPGWVFTPDWISESQAREQNHKYELENLTTLG